MANLVIYGIANCDSVRKARAFLQQHQLDYQFHDFKKVGIARSDLQKWLQLCSSSELINQKSRTWRTLSNEEQDLLKQVPLSDEALNLLQAQPTLLKRPLLIQQDRLLLGFNEAEYLQLVKT
ncbi:MAG: Spx/MgsR family RNA polymerase-binding regulatory protein [Thiotrichales bacterium]|nr:Spx/MgsR family RNA polymerase-binding regulatory protein [Thiotrichales bacterium]